MKKMKMKAVELWEKPSFPEYGWYILVPAEKIEEGASVDGYIFPEVSAENVNVDSLAILLNFLLSEKAKNLENFVWPEDIEDFVSKIVGHEVRAKGVENYITPDNVLVWANGEFSNLLNWETVRYYGYWDGHNWVYLERGDIFSSVTYNPKEKISLDIWDGSN